MVKNIKGFRVIKLKDLLKEGTVWDREFGEPLPTLKDIMEKHNDCGCGGTTSCSCESVTEDVYVSYKEGKINDKFKVIT